MATLIPAGHFCPESAQAPAGGYTPQAATLDGTAIRGGSTMPRSRQVNVRLDDAEFELLKAAADADEARLSVWIRDAALDAAAPVEPEPEAGHRMPTWLAAMLLYVGAIRSGQGKPDSVDATG